MVTRFHHVSSPVDLFENFGNMPLRNLASSLGCINPVCSHHPPVPPPLDFCLLTPPSFNLLTVELFHLPTPPPTITIAIITTTIYIISHNRNTMSENATLMPPAEEEVLTVENVYVRELVDNLLKDAARIAKTSSEHTADDLLAAAGFYVLGEIPRLQTRRANAWNLFQRLEKENAPEEVRKQTDSVSYRKSRPGVKGDYQQFMKERWNKDPELRKKYERLAKGSAAVAAADDT
jgi:hypothetical protein